MTAGAYTVFEGDIPVAARIELFESSGPVSPKYQYSTKITVAAGNGNLSISCDDRREFSGGAPLKVVSFSRELTRAEYEGIWRRLGELGALDLNRDFIGPERRKSIGISFNHYELSLGDRKARCDYLLGSARDPEFAPFAAVISFLASLKDSPLSA